ncbi:MAG: hypothetical protein WAN46_13095 [Gammaproteobacteria bacterium]|jgi:hypothetical protein
MKRILTAIISTALTAFTLGASLPLAAEVTIHEPYPDNPHQTPPWATTKGEAKPAPAPGAQPSQPRTVIHEPYPDYPFQPNPGTFSGHREGP